MQTTSCIRYITTAFILLLTTHALHAQVNNWSTSDKEKQHIVGTAFGADFGVVSSFVYGYKTRMLKRPVITGVEFSFPYGEKMMDDWKVKAGGQIKLIGTGPLAFSARVQFVTRRYQNDLVKMIGFGSDLALTGGYYKRKWFVAAEAGFDKAIVTQLRHTEKMRENYAARDGWYMSTGGNFYYGIQAGLHAGRCWLFYLRGGKVMEQDFKHSPTLPLYAQIGINRTFHAGRK
jgi:hypothetical protein